MTLDITVKMAMLNISMPALLLNNKSDQTRHSSLPGHISHAFKNSKVKAIQL